MTDRSLTNPEKGLIKMFFNQAKRKGNKKEMERLEADTVKLFNKAMKK